MLVMSFQLPTIQRFYGKVLGKTSAANEYAASARRLLFTPRRGKEKISPIRYFHLYRRLRESISFNFSKRNS